MRDRILIKSAGISRRISPRADDYLFLGPTWSRSSKRKRMSDRPPRIGHTCVSPRIRTSGSSSSSSKSSRSMMMDRSRSFDYRVAHNETDQRSRGESEKEGERECARERRQNGTLRPIASLSGGRLTSLTHSLAYFTTVGAAGRLGASRDRRAPAGERTGRQAGRQAPGVGGAHSPLSDSFLKRKNFSLPLPRSYNGARSFTARRRSTWVAQMRGREVIISLCARLRFRRYLFRARQSAVSLSPFFRPRFRRLFSAYQRFLMRYTPHFLVFLSFSIYIYI